MTIGLIGTHWWFGDVIGDVLNPFPTSFKPMANIGDVTESIKVPIFPEALWMNFHGEKKRVVHHHSHHQANESRNVSISNFVGWTYYYRLFLCTLFSANYDCRLSNSSHERNMGDSKFIKLSGFACQVQKGWQLTLDCDGLVERVLSLGCSPFAWRGRTIHRTCSAPPKSLGWVMGKSAHHAF